MPAMPMAGSRAAMVVGRQADKQRDQDHQAHDCALSRGIDAIDGERVEVEHHQQEDDRQGDQQDLQGDLVGRLAPLGAFHQARPSCR